MSFPRYPEYRDSGVEWLGEVPAEWNVKRIRFLAELNPSKSEVATMDRGTVVSFLPMDAIGEDGSLRLDAEKPIGELESGYTYFRNGDVTIAKITPCYENGKGALMKGLQNGIGFGTTELIVARPKAKEVTGQFLHYLFMSPDFRSLGESHMYGAGGQKRVPDAFVRNFATAMPPLPEQTQIAAFLDRETAKIDALVAEQGKLIALLKEKRQAVISHTVTKGLDASVSMKDSGVEWLGVVPAHWGVVPLGKVTVARCDGPFGSGLKSEHYTDAGVRVVRLQNVRSDGFNGVDEAFIAPDYYDRELSGHDVIAGDVLIAGLGDDKNTVGRACVAPFGIEPAMVKADCFRYRVDTTRVSSEFVATALCASSQFDAGVLSTGSTRSRIPLSVMATRKVPMPPLTEQLEIAARLKGEAAKFDTLTAEAQHAITLLQERRAALISAAVTGKIDVRHFAAMPA